MAIHRIRSGLVLLGVLLALASAEGYRNAARSAAAREPSAEPVTIPVPPPTVAPAEIQTMDETALLEEDLDFLLDAGWAERVGENLGIWVAVERQRLYLIEAQQTLLELPCATAEAGTGALADSQRTPLGWHAVAEKFGDDAQWGQVFRSRAMTDEIWKPGTHAGEDLVLTRLLWLTGLEPGKNQGTDAQGRSVDSKARYIYLHGTNEEDRLGTPSSHGCIRLGNHAIIDVFNRVPVGTPVLIAERTAERGHQP